MIIREKSVFKRRGSAVGKVLLFPCVSAGHRSRIRSSRLKFNHKTWYGRKGDEPGVSNRGFARSTIPVGVLEGWFGVP